MSPLTSGSVFAIQAARLAQDRKAKRVGQTSLPSIDLYLEKVQSVKAEILEPPNQALQTTPMTLRLCGKTSVCDGHRRGI